MITGIARIRGFGVYENYIKPAGTNSFGVKNLIYGWNYSGKTSLARVFAQLESKIQNPDLTGCEFSFETDGHPITNMNFPQCGLTVRVFSADFVRENLRFEGSTFNPILLLGKESEEAQKKIEHLTKRFKDIGVVQKRLRDKGEALVSATSASKTEAAKHVRQSLKLDPYTATHLGHDIFTVETLDFQLLADQDLEDSLELALTPDSKKPGTVAQIAIDPSIDMLHQEATSLLPTVPTFSNTLKHLDEHPEIERWVESGLALHDHAGTCEFCGNDVSEQRLSAFRAHFSKDLDEHRKKVSDLLVRVKGAEIKLTLPNDTEFDSQFREPYRLIAKAMPSAVQAFNNAVEALAHDVDRKVATPRKPIEAQPLLAGLAEAVMNVRDVINKLVNDNNKLADNFKSERDAARLRVRYHYVKQFIDSELAAGREKQRLVLSGRITKLKTFGALVQSEIGKLQALISKAQYGREKINDRLKSMLGSEAVQIDVVVETASQLERFRLIRKGGKAARNLSEGERTAIAFSYFLVKLQELTPDEFAQTIVYIDDPISSLDANHLFQVTAAIKEVFFWKSAANGWTTRCKQFFLSTHNFQFLDLVRELLPNTEPRACLYFLRKVSPSSSVLGNMPKSLAKYTSEYHFLFETILKFRDCPDKPAYEGLLLLPNAVRRFTELYTYSRMPGDRGDKVDWRAEALFGPEPAKRILKVLHMFSHGNSMDKFAGGAEVIFDLEHAVDDLLNEIETKDALHWKSLMQAVSA